MGIIWCRRNFIRMLSKEYNTSIINMIYLLADLNRPIFSQITSPMVEWVNRTDGFKVTSEIVRLIFYE